MIKKEGKNQKREFLIIVPGARAIKSKNPFLQKLILFLYSLLWFHPIYPPKNYRGLTKKLKSRGRKIRFFRWSGGISKKLDIEPAVQRLVRLIRRKSRKHIIKILAFSIGAEISQLAITKLKDEKIKILVQTGAFNYSKLLRLKNAKKIINIFSDKDRLVRVAMDILEPFKAGQRVYDKNARNIIILGFEHENFHENCLIKKGRYKNKRIFDLYKEFLK